MMGGSLEDDRRRRRSLRAETRLSFATDSFTPVLERWKPERVKEGRELTIKGDPQRAELEQGSCKEPHRPLHRVKDTSEEGWQLDPIGCNPL